MMRKMMNTGKSSSKAISKLKFLENKLKKTWTDEKTGYVSYMIFARALYITWGDDLKYWDWNCFKEIGDDGVHLAKLREICWLDVRGKFQISLLSPGVEYEILYEVMVKQGGTGWELPITLSLHIDKKMDKVRQISLLDQPHGIWIKILVGRFTADANETEEINFDLYNHGGHWKTGLLIRGAIIKPVLCS